METLIEIFFRQFFIRFVGINIRYYFFKIIGKEKAKEYFDKINQDFFNAIVGVFVTIFLSILIAYLTLS